MKRPLAFSLVFFAAAIFVGRYVSNFLGIALFFVLAFATTVLLYVKYKYAGVFAFILFYIFGLIRIVNVMAVHDAICESAALSGANITLAATVSDISLDTYGRQKLVLKVDAYSFEDEVYSANVGVLAHVSKDVLQKSFIEVGSNVVFSGTLQKPKAAYEQGAFDESAYLLARGINYKMNVSEVLASEAGKTFSLAEASNRFKNKLIEVYDNTLPASEASIVKAMILGDKQTLDKRAAELYRVGGIYHILAISGLHVTIVAFFLDKLLSAVIGSRYGGLVTLLGLVAYCFFTGCAVSTVRAVFTFGMFVAAKLIYRASDLIVSTSAAALVILIFSPLLLWDAGFLLSFSAVFGLAFANKPIRELLIKVRDRFFVGRLLLGNSLVLDGVSAVLAVSLFNTPVSIYFFRQVVTYSLLGNLIIIPTVSFVVLVGIFVGLVGLLSIGAATFLSSILYYTLNGYKLICTVIEALPYSIIMVSGMSLFFAVVWYVAVFIFVKVRGVD